MANAADEHYDDHEEGEYHFSDDEANYDVGSDVPKVAAVAEANTPKEKLIAGVKKYRRMLISLAVFFILIFVIYKMLSPTSSSNTPPTDFSQTNANKTPATNKMPAMNNPPVVAVKVAPPAGAPVSPVDTLPFTPQPVNNNNPAVAPMPMQPAATPPQAPSMPTMNPPVTPPPLAAPTPVQPAASNIPAAPLVPPMASNEMNAEQTKMIMDRLAALEDQNSKLVSLLQNQVAQKMAETDAENKTTEEKIRTLNKRLGNIEASLNKMAQLLRDDGISKAPMAVGISGLPPARVADTRVSYSVQAIIPGRAWLKSDAGDTVTVAEGDMLRDYGRITKIDPYDGVVYIDTGRKIITLSYGTTGD